MLTTREFRLASFEREARQLATCTGCYGSGADRHVESRACDVCKGAGRAAREPHVVELLEMLRASEAEAEQLARDRYEEAQQAKQLRQRVAFLEGAVAGAEYRAAQADTENDELRRELDRVRGLVIIAAH